MFGVLRIRAKNTIGVLILIASIVSKGVAFNPMMKYTRGFNVLLVLDGLRLRKY